MELMILGCGTSTGVPVVGCRCRVCRSEDPRNKRMRSSIAVRLGGGQCLLVDTPPDLRTQALNVGLNRLDAVFYSHTHADHIHGIDELRTYNFLQRKPIDVYGASEHIERLRSIFSYIFSPSVQKGGGKPQIDTHTVTPGEAMDFFGTRVVPLRLWHGKILSIGWRIGDIAYLTDVSRIPDEVYPLLKGVKVAIIGALRWSPHTTHFCVEDAVREAHKIGAERTYLTHMGHDLEYTDMIKRLPAGVEPAVDGMRVSLP